MNCHCILLKLWMTFSFAKSQLDLPEIIYEKCPYSDICNRTASMSLNIKGLVPCCSSCKCDDKCGLRLDCCFDDLDRYRLTDKGIIGCINPFFGVKNKDPYRETYWMIQTCNINTEDGFWNNKSISCEMYDAEGKYAVEPVSSKENGYIYINADCAKCNNVYNFTKWNYQLVHRRQLGPAVWDVKNYVENYIEPIVYIPPQGENWSMARCFKKFQEPCNTNSTFKNLCLNLKATYQMDRDFPYKNLFCAWCENGIELSTECMDQHQRAPPSRFTVLIDNSVIARSKLGKLAMIIRKLKPDSSNETSVLSHLNSSLLIYCPDGMLMTHNGCRYFIRRWYIPSIYIQFKLWAIEGNEMSVATLNVLTPEERSNPLLWMKLPCRQVKATVLEVFHEIGKEIQDTVQSFIVSLWKETPAGINPLIILPMLNNCLKYNWYVEILGEKYSFHPTLDKYFQYVQDGQQKRINKSTNEREDATKPKLYERIATGPRAIPNSEYLRATVLLKTFFCDQIYLPMKDVEVFFGEIRILSENITLGNNEFRINFQFIQDNDSRLIRDLSKTTFSVCLDDYVSSYRQERSGSVISSRTFVLEQMIIYFAIIQLMINSYD